MKKLLLGLGTISLAILPVAAMVSCSTSDSNGSKLNSQEFNTTVATTTKAGVATQQNVIDPAFNTNAQEILLTKINSLTVEMLQHDFDKILTDFYDVYEFENSDIEIELMEKGIKVLSISTATATTPRVAKLRVSYEMETEQKDGTESILTKDIDWTIKAAISSQAQIDEITEMIKKASTNTGGIDLSDLKEYFLGENDDDMDFDDLGVFDRIKALNRDKSLNNLGGLIGYELTLNDIFSQLVPGLKTVVDMNTIFFAPSASLDNTFVYPSTTGAFIYEFDSAFLGTQTLEQVTSMTTGAQLESILTKQNVNTEMAKLVKDIVIVEVGPLLKITVNFTDSAKLSEVISLNPSLLKPSPTPPQLENPKKA